MNKEKLIIIVLEKLEDKNLSTGDILNLNLELNLDLLKNLERVGFIKRIGNSSLLSSCSWEITREGKSFIKLKEKLERDVQSINKIVMTLPPSLQKGVLEKHPEVNLTDKSIKELFLSAKEDLRILSPYIDASFINYIENIKPNVRIKLLTTSSRYGKNPVLERLKQSKNNLEIKYLFEYKDNVQQFQVHAKVIISDNSEIYIGSANFKDTSMLYNLESGIISRDEQLIKSYSEIFDEIYSSI